MTKRIDADLMENCRRPPGELASSAAAFLVSRFGPLAPWWLQPEVLEKAIEHQLAPRDRSGIVVLDWFLFGAAIPHEAILLHAWKEALHAGLGQGARPVAIVSCETLSPTGAVETHGRPWTLDQACFPANGLPGTSACHLHFPTPLRILRQGALIHQPKLADLVVAACRRTSAMSPSDGQNDVMLREDLLEDALRRPSRWCGRRLELHRFSARQDRDVELRGVTGLLHLPEGPGYAWPLLAAAHWLHLGKGTIYGMGQVVVEPGAIDES